MNKRGQSLLAMPFLILVAILAWAFGFGELLSSVGQAAIIDNSLTGLEAFFWGNLNFAFWIFLIIGALVSAFGGVSG